MPFLNALRWIERSLLVTIFLSMVALYFTSVVTREIGGTFASQFAWIEEAVRLLNLFLVFLALGLALERGKHVGVDTFRDRLPGHLRRAILKCIDAIGLVFSLYVAWLGLSLVRFVLSTGQSSPTLGIPMGLVYCAPVAGFLLLSLRYGLSLFGVIDRFSAREETV
ncbi:TRAP transporter small permease [Qingshengfaniella alkalisoli]|uniref:TRAP transporter small permease protein n=1 Tax=Qingshengfaniella alkalisoli TaxID=2599296 RepID=A0A5B8J504_9RHOB|nr:TRAP transporter small permease subunit [Qingshengfaniella alkalisoli]QDY69380.1 TRAP transporter small permease [Qingshengfaniella alkalisoli]